MNKHDFSWVLGIFGTAIGAGILYLPLQLGFAGMQGFFFIMSLLFPAIYFSHRNYARILMASKNSHTTFQAMEEFLGHRGAIVVNIIYFLSVTSILLIYITGLNNDLGTFIYFQGWTSYNLETNPLFSLFLLCLLIGLLSFHEKALLRSMKIFVYPLMILLAAICLFLVPKWTNQSVFGHQLNDTNLLKSFVKGIPLLIFATNFSPALSSLVHRYKDIEDGEKKLHKIIGVGVLLIALFVTFFSFSCLKVLTPSQIKQSIEENISIMILFSDVSTNANFMIKYIGPLVGLLAIISSFLGHFLGAREGAVGIIFGFNKELLTKQNFNRHLLDKVVVILLGLLLWIVAIGDFAIVSMIGLMVAPLLAILLYLLPLFIIYRNKDLSHLRSISDIFQLFIGICVLIGHYGIEFL